MAAATAVGQSGCAEVNKGQRHGDPDNEGQRSESHGDGDQECKRADDGGRRCEHRVDDGQKDEAHFVEICRRMIAGENEAFCFTKKCIPCHRCSGNMRLYMRRVKYRNIVKILQCDACGFVTTYCDAVLFKGNYPTYRCNRKQCQTFCSARTLTRRLRDVAYDKLHNQKSREEITPQAKQQLMAAFDTCMVTTADGTKTMYSTYKAKLAREKLALGALSETAVLLRAMLADRSCTISTHLKTAIGDLSSLLSCFSDSHTTARQTRGAKPRKRSVSQLTANKSFRVDPGSVKDVSSDLPQVLSAAMKCGLEVSPSPDQNERKDECCDSPITLSGTDTSSSFGERNQPASKEDSHSWIKVSKLSSSFNVAVIRDRIWEIPDERGCGRVTEDNTATRLMTDFSCNPETASDVSTVSANGIFCEQSESMARDVHCTLAV